MPTASSKLLCRCDAADGTLAVTAEPAGAALSSAGEQLMLFSATMSACISGSSTAARRVMPASARPSAALSAAMAALTAMPAPEADAHSRGRSVYSTLGTDSAGQQMLRAAADSGLLLNPATLASAQQARQSAAPIDLGVSGAALTEHGNAPSAMDAFLARDNCTRSSWGPSAMLSSPGALGSFAASSTSLALGSASHCAAQHCSLVMAGIRLGPASIRPGTETTASVVQAAEAAAAGMLYEVAWLASHHGTSAAALLPVTSRTPDSGPLRDAVNVSLSRSCHVLAALDSRGRHSIRLLRPRRHAAAIAMSTLEALHRFTGDAGTSAVCHPTVDS